MKLFFAILLMSTVLSSEMAGILLDINAFDSCAMETSYEVESEKEVSENFEELTKVKFENRLAKFILGGVDNDNNLSLKYLLSTPYLEIHSPPPESFVF